MKDTYHLVDPDVKDRIVAMVCLLNYSASFPDGQSVWCVSHLWTRPDVRNRGYGAKILRQVCEEADKENTVLVLSVKPDPGIDFDRLVRLYERNSFEMVEPTCMERAPKHPAYIAGSKFLSGDSL